MKERKLIYARTHTSLSGKHPRIFDLPYRHLPGYMLASASLSLDYAFSPFHQMIDNTKIILMPNPIRKPGIAEPGLVSELPAARKNRYSPYNGARTRLLAK